MKNQLLVSFAVITISCAATVCEAQLGSRVAMQSSPAYEMAAAPLRNAPPRQYTFSKAVLSDIMRLMAEDAGIGFFGLPEGGNISDSMVTFTIKASPFSALETLAKAYGIALIHDGGIWYLRPANDGELIGRIYEINYNAQELVTKNNQSNFGGGGGIGGGGGGRGFNQGGASTGLNLQGSPDFFVTEPSRLLEEIRGILDLGTTGGNATFAPTASVDNVNQLSLRGLQAQSNVLVPIGQSQQGATASGGNDSANASKVIWNSDSNSLYVVATRQQHQWIEAYLAAADKPQPMIAVEVKFLEVGKNPQSEIGVDWSGVLGQDGVGVTLSDATGPINLANVGSYSLPTAILSYNDLNLTLRALYQDNRTRSVSYPRMVTLDNREVSFRSVINQPVLGSSASTSIGAGATQTSAIEYIPIGTVINVLPKIMSDSKVLLNVSVTVSDIVGTEIINGNSYPIATSRVYTAPLTVASGYTVAISGLDSSRTEFAEQGVPILAKLPIVGGAFKNLRRNKSRTHLMMLITPVILNSGRVGVPDKPMSKDISSKYSGKGVVGSSPSSLHNDFVEHKSGKPRLIATPVHSDSSQNVASTRKSEQTFGRKTSGSTTPPQATIEKKSLSADSTVSASVTAEPSRVPQPDLKPVVDPSSTLIVAPMEKPDTLPAPKLAAKPAPAPVPESKPKSEPSPAPVVAEKKKEEKKSSPEDVKLDQIKVGLKGLQDKLGGIPKGDAKLSPDDGQLVKNVYSESKRLLTEIDKTRADKSTPLQGDLGDTWWGLIQVKTQAFKMSKRSPESLAINIGGDDESADKK